MFVRCSASDLTEDPHSRSVRTKKPQVESTETIILKFIKQIITYLDLYYLILYAVPLTKVIRKQREDFREWKVQQPVFPVVTFNFTFSSKKRLDYLEN